MKFGDILDKWEKGQSRDASKNMDTWLRDNGVFDKDANEQKNSKRNAYSRQILRIPPDDVLDIHGLSAEQAWLSLENFFSRAKSADFKKLRIIHGKGNHSQGDAVLGRLVREFMEQCPHAGKNGHEKSANGGSGATWVLLK